MAGVRSTLNAAARVVLGATLTGQATIGPDSARGPATWNVTGVIVTNGRPGARPVPRVSVYLDTVDPASRQGLSYDGSFAQGRCNLTLTRGQRLIAVWEAGQLADECWITVTGEKW